MMSPHTRLVTKMVVLVTIMQMLMAGDPIDCGSWSVTRCQIGNMATAEWHSHCYIGSRGQVEPCKDWPGCATHCADYIQSCGQQLTLDGSTRSTLRQNLDSSEQTPAPLPAQTFSFLPCQWTAGECLVGNQDDTEHNLNCFMGATGYESCADKCPDVLSPSFGCTQYCEDYLAQCDETKMSTISSSTSKKIRVSTEAVVSPGSHTSLDDMKRNLPETPSDKEYVKEELNDGTVPKYWRTIAIVVIVLLVLFLPICVAGWVYWFTGDQDNTLRAKLHWLRWNKVSTDNDEDHSIDVDVEKSKKEGKAIEMKTFENIGASNNLLAETEQ